MLTTLVVLVTGPVVRQPDARRASPSWRATRAGGHGRPPARQLGGLALPADVLRREDLVSARGHLLDEVGRVGILVNAVGGNVAGATLGEGVPVLDMPEDAFREVVNLNLVGTLPFQVFGAAMTSGAIMNVSSTAAERESPDRGLRSGEGRDR